MVAGSVIFGFGFFGEVVDVAVLSISLFGVPAGALLLRTNRLGYLPVVALVAISPFTVRALVSILDPERPLFQYQSLDQLLLLVVPAASAFFVALMITTGRNQQQANPTGR